MHLAAQREAVAVWKAKVKHDDSVGVDRYCDTSPVQCSLEVDRVPGLGETALHYQTQRGIVFHHEYAHEPPSSHINDERNVKERFTIDSCWAVHDACMASDDELKAHIFRRLTFSVTGDKLAAARELSPVALIDRLLDADPLVVDDAPLGTKDDWGAVIQWYFDTLRNPEAGVHERMVWFWHGHLTSSLDKSSPRQMARQHMLFRRLALGNFRELLREVTLDPAMLYWLDGAYSTPDSPNENYARELMELFALGRSAGYTERDVQAAADALSGWSVNDDNDDEVIFDDHRPQVRKLFDISVRNVDEVIDTVCDHPACAPYVAGRVYWYFHGVAPSDAVRAELGAVFADNGLEIRPLLEAVVRHQSFLENRLNRPKTALEWYVSLCHLYQREVNDWWPLEGLGQVPFGPPNVAGWPDNSRWLSVGAELNKAKTAWDYMWDAPPVDHEDVVGTVLARTGLNVSRQTRAALDDAMSIDPDAWEPYRAVLALVPLTPEFNVA
jgi:hypothetical protein